MIVEVPEQGQVEFPDGMSDDDIAGVIQKQFYAPKQGTLERARELGSSPYSDDMGVVNPVVAEATRGNEPLAHLPRVEQQPDAPEGTGLLEQAQAKGRQINAAVVNAGAGLVEGLTSPTNIQLLPAAAAPGLGRVVSALFGVEMLRHVPEQVQAAEEAPTFQRKLEGGLGVVATMLFAGAAGKHAIGKEGLPSLRETVDRIYGKPEEKPLPSPEAEVAAIEPAIAQADTPLPASEAIREPAGTGAPAEVARPIESETGRAGDEPAALAPESADVAPSVRAGVDEAAPVERLANEQAPEAVQGPTAEVQAEGPKATAEVPPRTASCPVKRCSPAFFCAGLAEPKSSIV